MEEREERKEEKSRKKYWFEKVEGDGQ